MFKQGYLPIVKPNKGGVEILEKKRGSNPPIIELKIWQRIIGSIYFIKSLLWIGLKQA